MSCVRLRCKPLKRLKIRLGAGKKKVIGEELRTATGNSDSETYSPNGNPTLWTTGDYCWDGAGNVLETDHVVGERTDRILYDSVSRLLGTISTCR